MTLPGLGTSTRVFSTSHSTNNLGEEHRIKEYVGSIQLSMGENVIQPQRSPRGWVGYVKKQGPWAQAVAGMGAAHTPSLFEEGRGRGALASGDLGLGCIPSTHPQLCDPHPGAQHLPPQPGVTPGASEACSNVHSGSHGSLALLFRRQQ